MEGEKLTRVRRRRNRKTWHCLLAVVRSLISLPISDGCRVGAAALGVALFQGKNYFECCPFAGLALHFDGATVIVNDAIGDRQTQPHALAFLGREERLKNPV